MTRLLLVGAGPHARTFYLPYIARAASTGVRLSAVVELDAGRKAAEQALRASALDAPIETVSHFDRTMPDEVAKRLDEVASALAVDGVIVATDPLSHAAYVRWALAAGLPVLLDKPITSRSDAVSSSAEAFGIEVDYHDLVARLRDARGRARICVSVCAHRRWHPAFDFALTRIREVSAATGCPVTAVHGHHSDGQWRLPWEMVNQSHHSYNQGHGKLSHSGHHFLDCAWRFISAGSASGKTVDGVRVQASFVQPRGHIRQIRRADYIRLFGPEYAAACPPDDDELDHLLEGFGELDVAAVAAFTSGGVPVCNASFDLLHNGWSRRHWLEPGDDLYKGNGRVKHEHHRVHVGPFLAVHIHSYQSKDKHDHSDAADLGLGGNNHFEVVCFQNASIVGGGPPLEILESDQWVTHEDRLLIEEVKGGALDEFVAFVRGEIEEDALRSPLESHLVPVLLLSGMYRAHVGSLAGESPVVTYEIPPDAYLRAP